MINKNWNVHKFGGTSVLNADRFRNVYKILTHRHSQRTELYCKEGPKALVVSAMKGVTDDLIQAVVGAEKQDEGYKSLLQKIWNRHQNEITNLLTAADFREPLLEALKKDFTELHEILRGVWLVQSASQTIFNQVSGMGEVWSAQILNAYLKSEGRKTQWLDARDVLIVSSSGGRIIVNWEKSKVQLESHLKKIDSLNELEFLVITGFVAREESGAVTTLGRNGSDYSASIFGSLFHSQEIVIWTDVDGVLSADPRWVPEAVLLDEMSYSEVTELAYFGAKVVHPATMAPAIELSIPIWIRNSLKPEVRGTCIHKNAKSDRQVKGFSTIDKISLLNLEGTGMVGVPGVAERLFGALRSAGVNVVLISQASSEQSICLAIEESQGPLARKAIEQAFALEIQKNLIQPLQITNDISILAAVGDNMRHTPGIAGRFFTALGQSGISVRAIAQGSSERNISAVIDTKDAVKALRTVHSSFVLPHLNMSLGLIGTGLIGSTFLKQLSEQTENLKTSKKINIQVRAIANSKKMWLSENEIPLQNWKEGFERYAQSLDLKKLSHHLQSHYIPHSVLIEATASSSLTPNYVNWLNQGLHLISPNKKANTGSFLEYKEIRQAMQKSQRHFLYSTNVGAGLPIIQTLRDLKATGDEIIEIEGILSGTLSYIFNEFSGTFFSKIVCLAKEKGYTEPDPREDLSGQDVVRKLVILAREIQMPLEVNEVEVMGLVPEKMQCLNKDEFMARIQELDDQMEKRWMAAKEKNEILRFVASIDSSGKAKVGLKNLPHHHVFSKVTGTDNIVLFKTRRYFHQPLVIQGPGAGPEVTAAGVFADLLRLSQYLGAPL